MPFDKKEYDKKFREQNKEYFKQYRQKNKEKRKQYNKEYRESEKGKKINRINNWKNYGVVHHNFDELYEKYINTEYCELCSVKLTEDKRHTPTTRCLDHCHETGEVRNIVCNACNVKRG